MRGVFFIAGPTAVGKSEIAADVASALEGEIISADAFQIYRGFELLTAKPGAETVAKAPHHLIGMVSPVEEMNAERFRQLALRAIGEIHSRGKFAIVVGGSGLYIKALTHGLTDLGSSDPTLRTRLSELSLEQLREKLVHLDPETEDKIDIKNRRRLVRAIEICLTSGKPISTLPKQWKSGPGPTGLAGPRSAAAGTSGVFVFRNRDELYARINGRVESMFENGVIDEVRSTGFVSKTASQMIGLREIRELLRRMISEDPKQPGRSLPARAETGFRQRTGNAERLSPIGLIDYPAATDGSISHSVAQIQQATRRYAKRQLTWFRHQTNFEPLNLSLLTHSEAVKWISQLAKAFGVRSRE